MGRAVGSLAAQQYPGEFRMILVDDASQDGTARHRPGRPRRNCTWSPRAPCPPVGPERCGPSPKECAPPTATTCCSPTPISCTRPAISPNWWRAPQQGDYDLVSYMVRLQCRTLAEQALIPAFVFFFFLLYPPAWIRDPRRRTAGAAGGCILIRRAALERIGGIARIRGELIDDCALARAVKQSGGRVWLGLSATAASIRHYRTFGEIGRMISRTAFTQLSHSVLRLDRAPSPAWH